MTRLGLALIAPALLLLAGWASLPILALWAPLVGAGLADSLRIVATGCAGALACVGAGLGLALVIGARGVTARPSARQVRQVAAQDWPQVGAGGSWPAPIDAHYEEVTR